MKSGFIAVMALLGHVSAVQLNKESMYDPEYYASLYTNVLLETDAGKHHNGSHKAKDAYDWDPNTVSPYDADPQFKTSTNEERKEWFKISNEHKANPTKIFDLQMKSHNLAQKDRQGKDAYDYDPTTTSPYDAANNINGGNPHGIKSAYTDNDTPIGPKEKDLIAALKKGYWWDEELKKELARPAGAGQADARTGFEGAIPYTPRTKKQNCEAVGAKCDEPPAEKKEAPPATPEEKQEKETETAAKEMIKEVKDKKAKDAGAAPAEAPAAEPAPAFAQVRRI